MRLRDLEQFAPITIQMHDNPDADAIASGYALYKYFEYKGIDVRLVYSGRYEIQKTNLKLFINTLEIPIEYIPHYDSMLPGLLLTVDSQYGAGNITRIRAEHIAVIDHHQLEINDNDIPFCEIQPNVGSCATLCWRLLKEENYPMEHDIDLGTALYYGLYMDTNQFSEMGNPLDMDMRDDVKYDKAFVNQLRNSNLTLKELEIAGIALIRYIYNEDYRYAIIQAKPCDPNLLGLISDFLLQVDQIDTCVVYNASEEGFKFSVRSCIKEVRANELAQFLAAGIGSGGGHNEKAGGFISRKIYESAHAGMHTENYFGRMMTKYFENYDIIDTIVNRIDVTGMESYVRKDVANGYVKPIDIFPEKTPVMVRTLLGDRDMQVRNDIYLMIGLKGEVSPIAREEFEKKFYVTDQIYNIKTEYIPRIKDKISAKYYDLFQFAKCCYRKEKTTVYAKQLDKAVKIFTKGNLDSYILGNIGDYIVVSRDDFQNIYVVEQNMFSKVFYKDTSEKLI